MLFPTKGFPLGGIITQLTNHPGALGLGLDPVGVRNVPLVAWKRLAPCSHTDVLLLSWRCGRKDSSAENLIRAGLAELKTVPKSSIRG
jgi:hypothetical protein